MLRTTTLFLCVVFVFTFFGCSASSSIKVVHASAVDFSNFKTFTLSDSQFHGVDDAVHDVPQIKAILNEVIAGQLTQRGLKSTATNPDLQVVYKVVIAKKVAVSTVNDFQLQTGGGRFTHDPGFSYGSPNRSKIDQYEYEAGTLVIDLIETKTKEPVWRGTATKIVDPKRTDAQRRELFNKVISDMLKKYPPK